MRAWAAPGQRIAPSTNPPWEIHYCCEEGWVAKPADTQDLLPDQTHQRAGTHKSGEADALTRYVGPITEGLRRALAQHRPVSETDSPADRLLDTFYGQMEYHFGWRDESLRPAEANPGKLVRPTLLLLACELAAARVSDAADETHQTVLRALPAAVAIELVHNFSLIHDDIEDSDQVRRHRATLWRLWGQPQAINTGDGMFALARLALLDLMSNGVPAPMVVHVSGLLDETCVRLCEGQHLDMRFEGSQDVTIEMYHAMIQRKTAALIACALEMGAYLGGASDVVARQLAECGMSLGLAFQLRDDLLGIWAPRAMLGKEAAGDLRRKKMSLPVIHALQHAAPADRARLLAIYAAEGPATADQVAVALEILERTGARERVLHALREQSDRARASLSAAAGDVAAAQEPHRLIGALIDFVGSAM